MSQDLNALERDVEQARAKFADDLARLRSPANLARFKDDLWAEARETKDEWVDKTKEAAKDTAQRLLEELKDRVAANPVAMMAIGAGLAWRLVHRPPIATLLVGLGLVGLARTAPSQRRSQSYMGLSDEDPVPVRRNQTGTEAFAEAAKEIVQDWSAQAGDAARETAAQIADKASAMADCTSEALHDVRAAARDTVAQVTDKAGSVASRASQTLRDAVPDERDAYLLGAAALAVAAAVGIAYQRRDRTDGQFS
jgi:gas vesicle protein